MDPLTLAAGAGILAAGLLFGYVAGRRDRNRPARDPEPICGCGDHRAMHDPETGECHEKVEQSRWSPGGAHVGYDHVQCTCRQYVGPEPISSLWSPPVLPEGSGR